MEKKQTPSFDSAASAYDAVFTHSEIGKRQRDRVYFWLENIQFFKKPKQVFEVNCGTGYDAEEFVNRGHQVIATDDSAQMIEYAESKRKPSIKFYQLSFKNIAKDENISQTEALFSNFGGLNCLKNEDLKVFIDELAQKQKAGELFIGVIMAKNCLMEDLYHLLKFQFNKLGRRNTNKGLKVNVEGVDIPTYYHSPKELKSALLNNYEISLIKPVAIFLPPSYLEGFFIKQVRLLRFLNNLEKIMGKISALSSWSDHYIIVAKRR